VAVAGDDAAAVLDFEVPAASLDGRGTVAVAARVKIFEAGWSEILCGLWFVLVGWLVDPRGLG